MVSNRKEDPLLIDWLSKKGGIVNTVYKRWFVLYPDSIEYYEDENFKKRKGIWYFTVSSAVTENNTRDFAFVITRLTSRKGSMLSSSRSLMIFADDSETRSRWVDTISDILGKQQNIQEKVSRVMNEDTEARWYASIVPSTSIVQDYSKQLESSEDPLRLDLRVISGKNLSHRGKNMPYVKIKVGNSVLKSKPKDMSPDGKVVWDESFNICINPHREKYAFVEVWDNPNSIRQPVFLGFCVLHLKDYLSQISTNITKKWYTLGRRSEKSHISGKLQIEIFVISNMEASWPHEDYTSLNLNEIHNYVLKSRPGLILKLPILHDQLEREFPFSDNTDNKKAEMYYSLKYLPSISTEYIENIFRNVYLCSSVYGGEVLIKGSFYKTNYRIVFIENALENEKRNIREQFFLQFPLGCIGSIDRFNTDSSTASSSLKRLVKGESPQNILSIRGRTSFQYQFLIHNKNEIYPTEEIHEKYISSPKSGVSSPSFTPFFLESDEYLKDPFNQLYESINFYLVNPELLTRRMAWIHKEILKSVFADNMEVDLIEREEELEDEEDVEDEKETERFSNENLGVDLELAELELQDDDNGKLTTIDDNFNNEGESVKVEEKGEEKTISKDRTIIVETENNVGENSQRLSIKDISHKKAQIEGTLKVLSDDISAALFLTLIEDWSVDGLESEYLRLGVPDGRWRLTLINENYKFAPSYPSVLAVPSMLNDEEILQVGAERSKGRIPVLVWRDQETNATICRSSQPMVGLLNNSNEADVKLLQAIHISSLNIEDIEENDKDKDITKDQHVGYYASWFNNLKIKEKYVIIDARPELNARANQAQGMGFESTKDYTDMSQVIFMDIGNIHVMRKAYDTVETLCTTKEISWDHFHKEIDATKWLHHLHKILAASQFIADIVNSHGISVLIHCSDGWDRTSQLSALSQLLLDPYYRTINGFQALVEKEWVRFGHKFADRLGLTKDGYHSKERSPIFFQWLDCVHQLLMDNPNAFQFNEDMLLVLANHLNSGWFGNFLYNTERDRINTLINMHSFSIWTLFKTNPERFHNENYNKKDYNHYTYSDVLQPVVSIKKLRLWNRYFFANQETLHRKGIYLKEQHLLYNDDTNYYTKLSIDKKSF